MRRMLDKGIAVHLDKLAGPEQILQAIVEV